MLLSLLALALVDSINPSAIVVTLYLLSSRRVPAQVVVYVAAIFVTYLTLGVVMMLGLDALLPALRPLASDRLGIVVQSLIGLAMLVYAVDGASHRFVCAASRAARDHLRRACAPRRDGHGPGVADGGALLRRDCPAHGGRPPDRAVAAAADCVQHRSSSCRPYCYSWAISSVGNGWRNATPPSESDYRRAHA